MSQVAVEHCCEIANALKHTHNCTLCSLWGMREKASWISKWPESGTRMFLCRGCQSSGAGTSRFMLRLVDFN